MRSPYPEHGKEGRIVSMVSILPDDTTFPRPPPLRTLPSYCIPIKELTTDVFICQKIGTVGYCFGAKYVIRHNRPDQGKADAGYCAHPSFVEEDELKDMKAPLSIAAAETDVIFPAEKRHRTEEVLKEMGIAYQIK